MTPKEVLVFAAAYIAQLTGDISLRSKALLIVRFCLENPESAFKPRSKNSVDPKTFNYWAALLNSFVQSRNPTFPVKPTTVPDEVVSVILNHYFDVPVNQLDRVKEEHQFSMAAENMVGDLLERYLATVLEPLGWIWCSGSVVKAVDFVRLRPDGVWELLQIKNRDNSENSSSSAIRTGTTISKWFRTFSRRSATNWNAFPDKQALGSVSEDKFRDFVIAYIRTNRASKSQLDI